MKRKNLTIWLIPIYAISAKGQITLSTNDFPYSGLTLEIYEAKFSLSDSIFVYDTSLFNVGYPGQNQIYDFSSLEPFITDTINLQFIPAGSTPFSLYHQNADLAIVEDSGSMFKYYSVDSNSFKYIGFTDITHPDSNTTDTVHYMFSGYELLMSTDFQYNYQYNGSYGYGSYDSIIDLITGVYTIDTIKIDSYGKLILPDDTFQTLRAHIKSESRYSAYQYVDSGWLGYDVFGYNEIYKFYANNIGYPLVTVALDCEYQRILNIQYVNIDQAPQFIFNSKPLEDFIIYPNPAINEINFRFYNMPGLIYLTIRNSLSAIIMESEINMGNSKIDISRLARGIYFVELLTERTRVTQKIIKQ